MFSKKHWVANIQGKRWTVAEISRLGLKLNINHLAEFDGEKPSSQLNDEPSSQAALLSTEKTEIEIYKERLNLWLKQNKVPLKKLKVAISCPGVITRIITLPVLPTKDLDKLLTEQVDQYFTLNIADYIIDYKILEEFEEEGKQRLRVLLAAIPKFQWEQQWRLWNELGFSPRVTDLSADCIARLYSAVCISKESDIAIIDLGVDRVEFVLLEQGVFFLYSDIGINLKGITIEEESILNPVMQALADFIRFFSTRNYGKSIDTIYLTGYYSNLPIVSQVFKKNLGIETKVGFPNDWKPHFTKNFKGDQENWMIYGSLYGLVLRED